MFSISKLPLALALTMLIGCANQPTITMTSQWTMVYGDSQLTVLLYDPLDGYVDVTSVETAWKRGHQLLSVTVEGAISDSLYAEESWYDRDGRVITRAHRFTRRFNLAEKGYETLTWRSPVPQGATAVVRVGCSGPCGYQKDQVARNRRAF